MAGRPRNPETKYKVALRVTGNYRYAATQPCFTDPARACLQTSYRSQISEAARHTKAAKTSASLS